MKKFLIALAILATVFLIGCSESGGDEESKAASGDAQVIKVAIAAGESAVEPLRVFEEEVEKRTDGSLDIEFYPNGQLGGDIQALEGLRANTIEMAIVAPSPLATIAPKFNAFDIPFLFGDVETAYSVMDGEIGQELLTSLKEYGIKGLGYTGADFRQLSYNGDPIRVPSELNGLNLRTMENDLHIEIWKQLGASPQALAFNELYGALESNVVEGQENPYSTIVASKLHEVQDYITETSHIIMPRVILMNQDLYKGLSDDEKQAIEESIKVAVDNDRKEKQKMLDEAKKEVQDAGVEIIELSEEERQKWIESVQPIHEDFKETLGEDLYNRVMEAAGN